MNSCDSCPETSNVQTLTIRPLESRKPDFRARDMQDLVEKAVFMAFSVLSPGSAGAALSSFWRQLLAQCSS